METKEITIIEQKVNRALEMSIKMIVKDEKTLSEAIDFLKKVKLTGSIIKQKKEKITKPLNEALKNAREMFRSIEFSYTQSEQNVKQKILAYNAKEEEKRKEREAKLAERVDKGTMKMETAVRKMEEAPEIRKEGKVGKIQMRTIKKVIIEDESKLPRKYLVPNQSMIRIDALNGILISGVVVKEEQVIASL